MAAITYPSTLPVPSVSLTVPDERRLSSDVDGPVQHRGMQRDYKALQTLSWSLLTPAQAEILEEWWRVTLSEGGAWFTSTWPAPQGWVSLVRRFRGPLEWTHLPGGYWTVRAQVTVRGRGMDPSTGDPFWGGVLLLLDGHGAITKDSSPFNRTLITSGTPTLDNSVQLFGFPTYQISQGVTEYVGLTSDAFIAPILGNGEWCYEIDAFALGRVGQDQFSWLSKISLNLSSSGHYYGNCSDIGGSSISVGQTGATYTPGARTHLAFLRDNTGPVFSTLNLYVNGVLRGSTGGISKSAVVGLGAVFGRAIGFNGTAIYGNFANLRLTAGSARYYSDFTPPSEPHPTRGA